MIGMPSASVTQIHNNNPFLILYWKLKCLLLMDLKVLQFMVSDGALVSPLIKLVDVSLELPPPYYNLVTALLPHLTQTFL